MQTPLQQPLQQRLVRLSSKQQNSQVQGSQLAFQALRLTPLA